MKKCKLLARRKRINIWISFYYFQPHRNRYMLSIMRIITNNTMGSKTIHKRFSLGHLLCLSSRCGSIYSMPWSSSWTCVKWKIKTDHHLCISCFPCYVGISMRYMTYCILSNMTTYNKYAQDTLFSLKAASLYFTAT